jgi:polyhydroxybutyrate depolymerase
MPRGSVTVDGVERTFLVNPAAEPNRPLVLVLHGGGGRAPGTVGLTDMARRGHDAGFATAFPNGLARGWNDGRSGTAISERTGVDDVGFLLALIDRLAETGVADPTKVFCCGISNGAFMSDALARRAPDRLSGIGLVAGTAGQGSLGQRVPGRLPLPVMLFHGDADPIVPYGGGLVGAHLPGAGRRARRARRFGDAADSGPAGGRGRCVAAEALAEDWAIAGGCDLRPAVERLASAPGDLGVLRLTWQGPAGVPVVLHRIEGGGHTWPGGPQYLPARMIGRVATSLDATGILLSFFAWAASRPPARSS